jgi:hypothetical protein
MKVGLFRVTSRAPLTLEEVSGKGYARAVLNEYAPTEFPPVGEDWGEIAAVAFFSDDADELPASIVPLDRPGRLLVGATAGIKLNGHSRELFFVPVPGDIRDPSAKSAADLVTPKQLGMIRALAREAGTTSDAAAAAKWPRFPGIKAEDLSKRAASALIDDLKPRAAKPRTSQTEGA